MWRAGREEEVDGWLVITAVCLAAVPERYVPSSTDVLLTVTDDLTMTPVYSPSVAPYSPLVQRTRGWEDRRTQEEALRGKRRKEGAEVPLRLPSGCHWACTLSGHLPTFTPDLHTWLENPCEN